MTDQPNPTGADPSGSDNSDDAAEHGSSGPTASATAVLESLREAIDDLAERASPTVREYSARVAELAAVAADRAAPFAKRAGEATADASGKLAERSRSWASELRESLATPGQAGSATATAEPGAATATAEPGPAPSATANPDEVVLPPARPASESPATDEPGPA